MTFINAALASNVSIYGIIYSYRKSTTNSPIILIFQPTYIN